jgi:hypothetical protein
MKAGCWCTVALLAVAAIAIGRRPIAAQSALVAANASISTTALSIATVADLDFGVVIPGLPTVINPQNSPGAGQFELHGAPNAEFTLSFNLPTQLTVGPHVMPVSFSSSSGCAVPYHIFFRFACITFDPNSVYVTRVPNLSPPLNRWLFWLGGTVSPLPNQFPGVYVGTITFTAAYTGN